MNQNIFITITAMTIDKIEHVSKTEIIIQIIRTVYDYV